MKLSAIVLTKNEESNIDRCLKSLDFCDEIIVVDDFSDDRTQEIAKKYQAKVFSRHLEGDFAAQRNFADQKATGDWLLHIDADEVVSDDLMKEIMIIVMSQHPRHNVYYIKRRDHFFNKIMTMGEVSQVYALGLVRLMKKNSGSWIGEVHEKFVTKEKIGELHQFIEHYPHKTLTDFIRKINYYSSIRADELYKKSKRVSILSIVFTPIGKFIYTYFVKFGFLEGAEGFMYSFFMAFHSFLVRAKLHLKWLNHEKS